MTTLGRHILAALGLLLVACSGQDAEPPRVITVFNAGSLARPLRAALDSFAVRSGIQGQQESAGSLETARKLTELGHIPDVIALADYEVFTRLLMPKHLEWYVQFARNRMVLAYTDKSRGAAGIDSTNWWQVVQQPGVETGHSNPDLDPAGYRALLVFQLAERHYGQPGLDKRLRDAVPRRNIRPKSAELVALLQAGELDYAWEYESVAQAAALKYVRLPAAIDLGDPTATEAYGKASIRVQGAALGDSVTFRGQPIVFGISIPTNAANPKLAEQFVQFLLSPDGQRILRAAQLDVLSDPVVVGTGVPAGLSGTPAGAGGTR